MKFLSDVIKDPRHSMGFGVPNNLFGSADVPNSDQPLARCISLGLFNAMAQNGGLNFTRFSNLFDAADGGYPPFERARSAERSSGWADIDEVSRRLRTLASVSCWTMAEVTSETFNLIDQNGGPRRELASISSVGRVSSTLGWPDQVGVGAYRGPVLYCDGATFDVMQRMGTLRSFFWKGEKWRFEDEYRFVYHPRLPPDVWLSASMQEPLDTVHWMRCSLKALSDRILVRPDAACETKRAVVEYCRAHHIIHEVAA